ncbi:hypothetical protein HAX54_024956, partial [Datura stramonium]|nr:hypothetical protein [Datura stramonium]
YTGLNDPMDTTSVSHDNGIPLREDIPLITLPAESRGDSPSTCLDSTSLQPGILSNQM